MYMVILTNQKVMIYMKTVSGRDRSKSQTYLQSCIVHVYCILNLMATTFTKYRIIISAKQWQWYWKVLLLWWCNLSHFLLIAKVNYIYISFGVYRYLSIFLVHNTDPSLPLVYVVNDSVSPSPVYLRDWLD